MVFRRPEYTFAQDGRVRQGFAVVRFLNAFARGVWYQLFVVIVFVAVLWQYFDRPLTKPRIIGDLSVAERLDVENVITALGAPNFMNWQALEVAQKLGEIPWVIDVSVRRAFPATWTIAVERATPVALWQDEYYLDGRARLFGRVDRTLALPRLSGASGAEVTVLEHYRSFQALLDKHEELSIRALTLSAQGQWEIMTEGGTSIHMDMEGSRQALRRFVRVYEHLGRIERRMMKSADLNYVNGVAIEWCARDTYRCVGA